MKKFIVKITSAILMATILLSSAMVFFSSAETSEPVTCLSDHFNKLKRGPNEHTKERVPDNEDGTCGQVAMSMLLSYYDFYWNDAFVPTVYNSDGESHEMGWENGTYDPINKVVTETFTAYPETSVWNGGTGWDDFTDFAEYHETDFLHPYLVSISKSELITSFFDIPGLLGFQVAKVLQEYLSRRNLEPEDGVTVHFARAYEKTDFESAYGDDYADGEGSNRDTLFNTIKEQINNGNPVILFGFNNEYTLQELLDRDFMNLAHIMIAFEVVQNGNREDIKLHNGWNVTATENGDDTFNYYSTTPYRIMNSAIWIEIDETKLPHVCTRKYNISGSDNPNDRMCACEIYSSHSSHAHEYNIQSYNNSNHTMVCQCGTTYTQIHSLRYSLFTSSGHTRSCTCGYQITSNHVKTSYKYISQFKHEIYCACGYYMGLGTHSVVTDSPMESHCTQCGAVFNPAFDHILFGIKPNQEDE